MAYYVTSNAHEKFRDLRASGPCTCVVVRFSTTVSLESRNPDNITALKEEKKGMCFKKVDSSKRLVWRLSRQYQEQKYTVKLFNPLWI